MIFEKLLKTQNNKKGFYAKRAAWRNGEYSGFRIINAFGEASWEDTCGNYIPNANDYEADDWEIANDLPLIL